ncbi:uncharacterized protein LOC111373783 [Olea europaea var. sylvestris]|uniref:uncharacterized protein LOC111373783 n=1 Tax=Olea europaea var. sylvestris TaxID=158386 RepID=UPI000C1D1C50|nr:uncharacterized protein LOC111373783 [Olea europaea var. sylvestris]
MAGKMGELVSFKVPGYASLRRNLLHLAPRLASLPEEVKRGLEDPNSRYNFGWSHGKEKLESGKPGLDKTFEPDRTRPKLNCMLGCKPTRLQRICDVGLYKHKQITSHIGGKERSRNQGGKMKKERREGEEEGRWKSLWLSTHIHFSSKLGDTLEKESIGNETDQKLVGSLFISLTGLDITLAVTVSQFMHFTCEEHMERVITRFSVTRKLSNKKLFFVKNNHLNVECSNINILAPSLTEAIIGGLSKDFPVFFFVRYPSYCGRNIWPQDALPELELAFKALGKLILDVGLLLAYHCDGYVSEGLKHDDEGLQRILLRSRCHKGRLLYYFPALQRYFFCLLFCFYNILSSWLASQAQGGLTHENPAPWLDPWEPRPCCQQWCACMEFCPGHRLQYQIDSAYSGKYYMRELIFPPPLKMSIIHNPIFIIITICFSYVLGLTMFPYCAPKGETASGVDRSTFALFMQPDWDENLNFPDVVNIHQEFLQPNGSLSFGEYTEKLLDKYYNLKS